METQPLPKCFRRIELSESRSASEKDSALISLIAPLTSSMRFDEAEWAKHREACQVRRRRSDRRDDVGHLVKARRGGWALRYDIASEPGDVGERPLSADRFEHGAPVDLREESGLHRLYVTSIGPVCALDN